MMELFFKLSIIQQFTVIMLLSVFIIMLFAFFLNSKELGIRHFIDPGALGEAKTKSHFAVALIETIVGIVIVSIVVSLLTNLLVSLTEKRVLKEDYKILKEAFETNTLIRTRKLLRENNITSPLRRLYVKEAEVRLNIGREDIIKAIRLNGNFRLRMLKTNHEVVIENFEANRDYGSFINRKSSITIIATQNYSDAGIGHFAKVLADNLNANYISNEFYSSGAPLKSRHINFASNKDYIDMYSKKKPLNNFINDLKKLDTTTKLYIYVGTMSSKRKHDICVMFGGKKGTGFDVKNPTFKDIDKLKYAYNEFALKMDSIGLIAGTHDEYSNTNKKHLNNAIYNNFHKDTLKVLVSTKILWDQDEKQFYLSLIDLLNMIKELDK